MVPGSSLNPKAFFAGTRRQWVMQKTISSFAGFGNTDVIDTLRSGILSGYVVKVAGNLVITTPTGAVATTARWPYYFIRAARFQANGQSNLVNADGWALRARELMMRPADGRPGRLPWHRGRVAGHRRPRKARSRSSPKTGGWLERHRHHRRHL